MTHQGLAKSIPAQPILPGLLGPEVSGQKGCVLGWGRQDPLLPASQ